MFIDEVQVQLKAGDGGGGCVSFRREKYLPKGGPDGGDGGRGGNLFLQADTNIQDLEAYKYQRNWAAKNGEPGRGRQQTGADGSDCHLKVPPGTLVIDAESGRIIADLVDPSRRLKLLKGGIGGRGNLAFKSSVDQAPRRAEPGEPGQEGTFTLRLKVIADVGLVGFPNAGKSTLLTHFTNAHPKTAAYPFTTVHPVVGVCERPEEYDRLSMADIPGLVEGASENRGMGHRFLRHIERCRVLLYLLDMAGTDGRHPAEDFASLRREIEAYDGAFLQKPFLVAGNKMDEPVAKENLAAFRGIYPDTPVIELSCLSEEGFPELKEKLFGEVRRLRLLEEAAGEK